ncbi:MAG: ferrous iron transporter B [Tenericutes bacterium]|nr:ferrous iron transporter B [Mycoplasmatota bacterium]
MFLIYYFSVGVIGSFTVDYVVDSVDSFGSFIWKTLDSYGASTWLISLVVNGIISGVGAVLGFVPQLIILFISISILETTGYMSRISLLLDKLFRKIGLSGKSLIPFIVGSGCSVPGILSSRILENENERKMTAVLTPFIPCSAKLPIIALFSGYFFPKNAGLISASLYFFAIIVIVISALIIKKFIFKGTISTYVFELPEYKLPSIKYIAKDVYEKVMEFIKRAGSIILISSVVIWFLLSFSFNFKYSNNIETSILAIIGNKISWIFEPILGVRSWGATVSAIQGLVAKEQVISSMAVINGLSSEIEEGSKIFLSSGIFGFFTKSSAYAFMVFNLFSAPCFAAIGAMRKELGSTKKMLLAVVFQTVIAWLLATTVYQIGSRIGSGTLNITNIIIITMLTIIIILILLPRPKRKKSRCSGCPYSKMCNKNDLHMF